MTELKFRAWALRRDKTMGWIYSENESNLSQYFDWTEDFEQQQYTGLKDINGKDIYEGDIIVRRNDVDPKYHWVIEFHTDPDNSFAGFRSVGPLNFIWKTSACEIIGNIHDNPELLKS